MDDRILRRDDGVIIDVTPTFGPPTRVVDLGPEHMQLLAYVDGTWRFRHLCDRGTRGILIAAPALQCGPHGDAHAITVADPLTVTPSILCPDCGLHGFVTGGVWRPC